MKKYRILLIAVAALMLAVLACGDGSGGTYSFSQTSRSSGNTGHIEVRGSASGSVTYEVEIDEDYDGATVYLNVTAGVQGGAYTVEFLDDDGSVVFSLDVKPGELATGSGDVTTDDEGNVRCKVTASDAKEVEIIIDYELH